MRLCWWTKVKKWCGSSWSQDTSSFLRLTTRKSSELPVEPTSRKLPKFEETVSVKVSGRCILVLVPAGENRGGSLFGIEGQCSVKVELCCVRREHELAMVQSFRRLQKVANVVAGVQSVGKTPCPEVAVQSSAKKNAKECG